jgi:4-hydroxysphinganine ceramide fatty acyl 2-hydroxylase
MDGYLLKSKIQLDYTKAIYPQMLNANLQWDDYILFINEPKHLVNPIRDIRLFDSDILEFFTMTPWYFIPCFWSPFVIYHTFFENPLPLQMTALVFFLGMLGWTFTEYILHRFLFHSEDYWLPNHPMVLAHHFMLHGIHHAFPMDRYRLVFPVVPGFIIMYCLVRPTINLVVPDEYRAVFTGGLALAYILYDMIHYSQHHSSPKMGYFKSLKMYHMQHHYKDGLKGFGVSSKFWDYVFFTTC